MSKKLFGGGKKKAAAAEAAAAAAAPSGPIVKPLYPTASALLPSNRRRGRATPRRDTILAQTLGG